jgi:LPXTG-site transpeptidase (sortase) family protein
MGADHRVNHSVTRPRWLVAVAFVAVIAAACGAEEGPATASAPVANIGADRIAEAGLAGGVDAPTVVVDDPVVGEPDRIVVSAPLPEPTLPPEIIGEIAPPQNERFGRIVIPGADVDWDFFEGVDPADLARGPGHMPWTALPGQFGNAVISGHRTTNGAPFFHLDRLEPGDRITVETTIGTHTYEVVETTIVPPNGVWVTEQWDGAWLTLTTCHPRYTAQQRLIVFSKLVAGPNFDLLSETHSGDYEVPHP